MHGSCKMYRKGFSLYINGVFKENTKHSKQKSMTRNVIVHFGVHRPYISYTPMLPYPRQPTHRFRILTKQSNIYILLGVFLLLFFYSLHTFCHPSQPFTRLSSLLSYSSSSESVQLHCVLLFKVSSHFSPSVLYLLAYCSHGKSSLFWCPRAIMELRFLPGRSTGPRSGR